MATAGWAGSWADFELNVIVIPFLQVKEWWYELAEYAKLINDGVLDCGFLKDQDFITQSFVQPRSAYCGAWNLVGTK